MTENSKNLGFYIRSATKNVSGLGVLYVLIAFSKKYTDWNTLHGLQNKVLIIVINSLLYLIKVN